MLCVVQLGPQVRILDDPPTYWMTNLLNGIWFESPYTWDSRNFQNQEKPLVKEGLMRW